MLVPTTRTPIVLADLPAIVAAGYAAAFDDVGPRDGCRRVAIAHLLLEHGRRDHNPAGPVWGIFNFNLGNQDATSDDLEPSPDESPVALFRTVPECEGTSCQRRAQHVRRAFPTAAEGAAAYWSRLRDAYPEAFAAAEAGEPRAFVAWLRQRGYFTGSTDAYAATLSALVREGIAKGW
jgi:hypothetical protein